MKTLTVQPRAQGCAFVVSEAEKILIYGHTPGVEVIKCLKDKLGAELVVLPPPDKVAPDPAIASALPVTTPHAEPPEPVRAALAKAK